MDQTYPGGIKATTTYDPTGTAVELNYNKTTNCSSNCLWLRDKVQESIHGQILWRDSNLSHQDYSYDQAGRLRSVFDTVAGQCSSRIYDYDANSNRLFKKLRAPAAGGACPSSGGTTTNSIYDAADRLTNSGVVSDTLGRIATVPASHATALAGGSGLSTTYYANDMVRSQTQDNVTKGWLLDPTLTRHRASMPNGDAQEILHYSDDSDSPAWSEQKQGATVDSWSRNIEGIDGSLAAVYDFQTSTSTGTVTLQLPNLHGDTVATASNSSTATGLTATFETDEFGNPRPGSSSHRYGWLGAKQRRTELASGVIQMGVRSYVPAMGRFTSTDPVDGGSASAYDYGNADPVNNYDPTGQATQCNKYNCDAVSVKCWQLYKNERGQELCHERNQGIKGWNKLLFNTLLGHCVLGATGANTLMPVGEEIFQTKDVWKDKERLYKATKRGWRQVKKNARTGRIKGLGTFGCVTGILGQWVPGM